jgi:hypothetical protein
MYRVDIQSKQIIPMESVKFTDLDLKERFDIQEWLSKTPEILGEGEDSLLILAKELPVNDGVARGIRLDLLALDRKGMLVVIELKRDDARGDIDWQATKYAARCSRYQPKDIVQLLAGFMDADENKARRAIIEHIEGEVDETKGIDDDVIGDLLERTQYGLKVRIILVAREFHPDVAAASLWLRENTVDISCVRIKPFQDTSSKEVFVVSEKIIPLPETADYTDIASKKAIEKSCSTDTTRGATYANDRPELPINELEKRLRESLGRDTNLTPRLRKFLEILVNSGVSVDREKMKQLLHKANIGDDLGHAGRLLSNISQFLTKPESGHLRQIIEYESVGDVGQPGARKSNFKIKDEYKTLVSQVLSDTDF